MQNVRHLVVAVVVLLGIGCVRAADSHDLANDQVQTEWKLGIPGIPQADRQYVDERKLAGQQKLKDTSSDFAFKLFAEATRAKHANILLSPLSAYTALCMAANGAAGTTRNQMANALGFSGTIDEVNSWNQAILSKLNKNSDVQLEVANAVYSDADAPFRTEFIELCQRVYAADAHSGSFNDPKTLERINSWCSDKTHGKITSLLTQLSPQEKMVLLNAIYFKGKWAHPFETASTRDDVFTTVNGDKAPIKMMYRTDKLDYLCGSNFESVAIPYAGAGAGAGGKQRLYIFLPNPHVNMAVFQAQFNKTNWDKWMLDYHPKNVDLLLPRFKIECCEQLDRVLTAIGINEAFMPRAADFSNMVKPPCRAWIGQVLQKTYMEVNEEGTEAAAVTSVKVMDLSSRNTPVNFRVDRPFILALVDNDTEAVLFLGSVMKP